MLWLRITIEFENLNDKCANETNISDTYSVFIYVTCKLVKDIQWTSEQFELLVLSLRVDS